MSALRHPVRLLLFGVMLAFIVLLVPATALAANVPVGIKPVDIAFDTVLNKAYVVNYTGNSVSVINASDVPVVTLQLEPPATAAYPSRVAVDSTHSRAYVACWVSPNIHVINTETDEEILPALTNPQGPNCFVADVVVDEELEYVYVANWSGGVEVYDVAARTWVSVACGLNPSKMALNPATNKVYVANYNGGSVSVIDGNNLSAVPETIVVGTTPTDVAVDPSRNRIYVANNGSNTVTVIDGFTRNVIWTIPVGSRPEAIAIDTARNMAYVANLTGHSVSVINGTLGAVSTTVQTGTNPQDVAVDSDYGRVYVANQGSNDVTVIDVKAGHATTLAAAGTLPMVIEVNPATPHKVYAVNETSNDVTVLDLGPPAYDVGPPNDNMYTDPVTGITVHFQGITSPGTVTVEFVVKPIPGIPNYRLFGNGYYSITTTAGHTGWTALTFPFTPRWGKKQPPVLRHYRAIKDPPYYEFHLESIASPLVADYTDVTEVTFACAGGPLAPFAILVPVDEEPVTTPASAPWSLALLAAFGLATAAVIKRAKRTT